MHLFMSDDLVPEYKQTNKYCHDLVKLVYIGVTQYTQITI
jgi:hypothetical protein